MPLMVSLAEFVLERVLNEEPDKKRVNLLGTLPTSPRQERVRTIIRIEKTAFASDFTLASLADTKLIQSTDIYSWLAGWLVQSSFDEQPHGDVKIDIISPATDDHVRKYSPQRSLLVRETAELYATITKPYIDSFPSSRVKWVTDILSGESEQESILFNCPDYVILPDMKWDLHTVGSLYLVAISRDVSIRSLRDLRVKHIPLLKSIRDNAYKVVSTKWGLGSGSLRLWIHYQPSYYHLHVHIANASYEVPGFGMAVGQAHLLEDIIALLESTADTGIDIFERMTLTFGVGEQHGLYGPMVAAQAVLEDK